MYFCSLSKMIFSLCQSFGRLWCTDVIHKWGRSVIFFIKQTWLVDCNINIAAMCTIFVVVQFMEKYSEIHLQANMQANKYELSCECAFTWFGIGLQCFGNWRLSGSIWCDIIRMLMIPLLYIPIHGYSAVGPVSGSWSGWGRTSSRPEGVALGFWSSWIWSTVNFRGCSPTQLLIQK